MKFVKSQQFVSSACEHNECNAAQRERHEKENGALMVLCGKFNAH